MYVCAQVTNGACVEWVQATFLLPPLSVADALTLGWKYVAVMASAWGVSLIAANIMPR
jgi:hypothetical protein